MLLSSLKLLLLGPIYHAVKVTATGSPTYPSESFHESLTLLPLPNGKLSVLFEFTTYFDAPSHLTPSAQSHHSLTPPSLLLPLEQNNVSELTMSFVAGRWDQLRSGESGPLAYESSGGGGEVRGWLMDDHSASERWSSVTHALGGLFCAGLGPEDEGENVLTFGEIYPPFEGNSKGRKHFLVSHPHTHLCTENLTPFLSLLPSKGLSGLSYLLAQPGTIFAWGFKAEGIEVIMPDSTTEKSQQGRWRGWWEGVVDLPDSRGKRDFSIERLFGKKIPRPYPEAQESLLKLVMPREKDVPLGIEPGGILSHVWLDGKKRQVMEWDLLNDDLTGSDITSTWINEDKFHYPRTIDPPNISITRTVTQSHASDGIFHIRIINNGEISREAIYSEIWPWWVKGWMSEVSLSSNDGIQRPELLQSISYDPSIPPKTSMTTIHLSLTIPANETLIIMIPFTKLTLKYTEHRPDAERGVEIPSGVLTISDSDSAGQDQRRRIYSPRVLLDVPTPDFSMPYNVIIMSSTVMAVFFGLMQGALTRKWGWVELPRTENKKDTDKEAPTTGEVQKLEDKQEKI